MADEQVDVVWRQLRKILGGSADQRTDAELLAGFVAHREESAFAALVRRHGPMVLGVCRRILHDEHLAEDAFQATFLVLARKAGILTQPALVGNYLFGVAQRIALEARTKMARRQTREGWEPSTPAPDPSAEAEWRELRAVLDEELAQLPEKYRAPLILCDLEGQTHAAAARALGIAPGSVSWRLARGRELLRERLVQRGLALPTGLLAAGLSRGAVPSLVPASLVTTTVRAGLALAAGEALCAGTIPVRVAEMVEGALRATSMSKFKPVLALLLATAVGAAGVGFAVQQHQKAKETQTRAASGPHALGKGQEQPRAREQEQARTDRYGDPLPPDALLRLGTLRHRYLYAEYHWYARPQPLPDGKTVLTNTDNEVRWVDVGTGRLADSWPLPRGLTVCGFSLDGRLALLSDGKTLRLWDLSIRKEVRVFEDRGPLSRQVDATFARDGRTVATAICVNGIPGLLRVWDVNSGRQLWQEGKLGWPTGRSPLGFLPDGQTLVVLDHSDNRVSLCDRASGRERRSFPTMPPRDSRQWSQSPDGKAVLLGTAGTSVRAWDIATGRELPPLAVHKGPVRSFAFSRDGKTVLTGGSDPFVLVWNWPAVKLRRKIELGPGKAVGRMAVSPDGKRAEIVCWAESVVRSFDLETGKERPTPQEAHRAPVHGLAVAPDGKVVSAGADDTVRVWDPRTGRQLHEYRTGHPVGAMMLALSADGRLVATTDVNHGTIPLQERNTGRLVRTIDTGGQEAREVAFAPTGRLLAASADRERAGARASRLFLGLWDADTGRQVRRLEGARDRPVFSPDGRILAALGDDRVGFWEVATGRERQAPPGSGFPLAFSPDGRMLARDNGQGITLWELATGKERCRFGTPAERTARAQGFKFSPDGRWLARADGRNVQLWDVLRGRRAHTFAGHDSLVTEVAFAPDGRTLVSSSYDSTLLVWDVAGVAARQRTPPARSDGAAVATAWDDLAGADAKAAYRAIRLLVEMPGRSLPLLRRRLRPATPSDAKDIGRWLAALDSDRFEERERATRALAQQGDRAEAALQRLLAGTPSEEARKRAERLLARLQGPLTGRDRLQSLRALEVLEHIGTPEARQVLETLAKGAHEARLMREAKASLKRLSHRVIPAP